MRLLLLACAGGALGTGARYLTNVAFARCAGSAYPWHTFLINVVGSLLMGVMATLLIARLDGSPEVRSFVMVGILGGFTTFSAYSLEFATLFDRKDHLAAFAYLGGSVLFAILAFYAGVVLTKALLS